MTLYSKPCSIHNQLRTGAHMLSGDVRAFVESQAFTDGLVTAEKYDVEKARMTIAMLKCVALDPLRGADLHAFITQGRESFAATSRLTAWQTLWVCSRSIWRLRSPKHWSMPSNRTCAAECSKRRKLVGVLSVGQ